ncbi:hypothetical protein KAFR_0F02610 [Kazachstania africana CBS 2517]|uniref:Bromo domain-containing protein n=1 Tax=Kazachstania africana (strain ATCC 22294 / BCRC 22015 / CBS 2517 / CECT 1963 / NBRC 1671 / NRRL Y-8276) TaxID=1071382 RepID=H2AWV8_KAZAF|nr:hypothetical protein KAFR_0F02610 [Kazachstania africana CBS 2517]CCF58858.1 hypothetical protein KAFR_0F02610 [Kazachstania africana CBS 2517]
MDANALLNDILIILQAASAKCKVTDEKFPSTFFESDPEKIYDSYVKFIKKSIDSEGEIKNEDRLKLTTINDKFQNNEYRSEKNGFYRLFHDVKLVCTMLIHFYSPGTRNYQMVDKFYKFSTELILRECYRLGVQTFKNDEITDETNIANEDDDETELGDAISNDFIKISTNYKVPIKKTYHIKTRDTDLFSSIITRSSLDKRPVELPNSNFEINNVIPQTNLFEEAPKLGFVAANTSNIPDPTLPPTDMMNKFLHPNWYALPTTTWLEYGDYKSWAPSFNENGTVLDSTARGLIWLQKIGYTNILNKENEKVKKQGEEDEEEQKGGIKEQKGEKKVEAKDQREGEVITEDSVITNESNSGASENEISTPNDIKLENLFEWTPGSFIDDDEKEAFKNGTHNKLVDSILLKIKRLRKDRVQNKITKPSIEEKKMYFKVKRLLREVLLQKQISKLPMNHSKLLPVLQANYNGTIPVVRATTGRKRKYNKNK